VVRGGVPVLPHTPPGPALAPTPALAGWPPPDALPPKPPNSACAIFSFSVSSLGRSGSAGCPHTLPGSDIMRSRLSRLGACAAHLWGCCWSLSRTVQRLWLLVQGHCGGLAGRCGVLRLGRLAHHALTAPDLPATQIMGL
jgi:hypothetical protein